MMDSMPTQTKRHLTTASLVAIFAIVSLLLGLVGGASGFVLLSNSNLKAVQSVRRALHINEDGGSVAVPVKETLRLEESSTTIEAVKKVSPAAVSISASQTVTDFFGRSTSQVTSGGSGFIVTSDGLIVTNKHVVSDANASYKVVLDDGRILDATIKATDPLNDLAFVKVNATDLPTVEFGSSDDLQIGQYVMAVGNALGEFSNSVALGIVSAKNRSISAGGEGSASGPSDNSERLTDLIQTDAAINPGNSGGPLINLKGQVVGIDTAIASTTGGSIGIGFALPIDSLKNVINSVIKTGQIVRPYLGVRYMPVNQVLQQQDNLSVSYGALVLHGTTMGDLAVLPGSPADKAGIQENDILLEVNGTRIDDKNPLPNILQHFSVGDTITIKLQRKGAEQTVTVKLEQLK
jgi:serine protease Do